MKTKKSLLVFLAAALVFSFNYSCATIISKTLKLPPKENRVATDKDVMVAMRDGIRLATDVHRPAAPGKYPVILCRLPYGKNMMGQLGKVFAERGYVFVIQDCRATFNSEGDVFIPFVNDEMDGKDTVKWIADQPWFNGAMAAWGGSYFGYTQWQVADNNPYMKAFYPLITTPDMYKAIFNGGAFNYSLAKGWSMGVGKQRGGAGSSNMVKSMLFEKKPKWNPADALFNKPLVPELKYSFVELGNMDLAKLSVALGLAPADKPMSPFPDAVEKMIDMFAYPGFAYHSPTFNYFDRYQQVKAPALMVSGWYDIFLQPQLDDFQVMKKEAPEPAKSGTRIIIGPWGHADLGYSEADKSGKTMVMFRDMFDVSWFDYWVKGKQNGADKMPPVKIYVMGKNQWRDENEWPLARTKYTAYYLHSKGNAKSKSGDGVISLEEPPALESTDEFKFDPMDPVPSAGGNNLMIKGGAQDQKDVEARDDVLVYTSAPVTKELEVTGPIKMTLFAASSATDTDFTAKLCVVRPDGKSINLADGAIRARYHKGYDNPELVRPGEVIEYEIELWSTSYAFQPGEKIRIQVSSSNFPKFDINSNCGGEGGKTCFKKAYQTIYHDKKHPSKIVLPVIP